MTVQIGDAAALAKAIHIPVMHDFRAADVAAGGQGAPFVPVYHRALAQSLEREGPIVVVNIGGVSNITYIDGADTLIACDTGPGNALLDDFMFRGMNQRFDNEGRTAAQGKVDEAWIARALQMPFFALPPPKSLDRNDFAALKLGDVSPPDGAATLTAFTAAAIARIVPLLPKVPKSWIVAGGGARNLTMLRMLRERLARDRRGRGRAGLGGGRHRGAGLRLPGGAGPEGPAAELSRHHGGADPDDRRGSSPAVSAASVGHFVVRRILLMQLHRP
jgi:anhydro-N-acetylmuramic acid kinase